MLNPSNLTLRSRAGAPLSLDLPYHTVDTEYSEEITVGKAGNSYEKAGVIRAPSVRVLTLTYETLLWLLNPDGTVDLDSCPEVNLARLERLYRTHRMAVPFQYDHPLFGRMMVRFRAPLKLPRGLPNGGGAVEAVTVELIEVPTQLTSQPNRLSGELDLSKVADKWVFDFPYHTVAAEYLAESQAMPLGLGYTFTTLPAKPEMRLFTLQFKAMRWCLNSSGLVDWQTDGQLNLARLEYLYQQVRTSLPFWYDHPVFGRLLVRFKNPLKLPSGDLQNNGWIGPIELTLIEVPK